MAYEMLTRSGRNFYEVTSVMQNSIRKGEYEIAGHCVWELLPKYESYLRKRFLVISAEDCFGIITKEILNLSKTEGSENVERALSLLCRGKKNRDADYFVCNLMRDGNLKSFDKEIIGKGLVTAIQDMDVRAAGEYSYELFGRNRKYLWKILEEYATRKAPHLSSEFSALHEANESVTKPNMETIFVAKAIVLLWTEKEKTEDVLSVPEIRFDGVLNPSEVEIIKRVENCQRVDGLFPEWAYNWHTYHGKYKLRRDAVHAISNDQNILTPLEENLFDDCTWNEDINACLGKWNPRKRNVPYDDGKRNPEEKYPGKGERLKAEPEPHQLSIFDL